MKHVVCVCVRKLPGNWRCAALNKCVNITASKGLLANVL
jgi:hypothetical protein